MRRSRPPSPLPPPKPQNPENVRPEPVLGNTRLHVLRFELDGKCIADQDRGGPQVYLNYAAAGDIVQAELRRGPSHAIHGDITSLIHRGNGRVAETPCPLYFKPGMRTWCGGCDMQHLTYDTQLEAKHIALCSLFRATRLLGKVKVEKPLRSPKILRYRNKIQVPFGMTRDGIVAGFFRPASHEIVDFSDCPVQDVLSVEIIRAIKKIAQRDHWTIYNEEAQTGWLRHVFIRTTSEGKALLAFVGRGEPRFNMDRIVKELTFEFPQIASVYLNIQDRQTNVIMGPKWIKLGGEGALEETIGRNKFLFYPGSFLQVNTPAAELLYKTAADLLAMGERTPELYDLYCGVGTIGISVGRGFRFVTGIEENQGAVACAWKNAERNGAKNMRFLAGHAETVFSDTMAESLRKPVSVIVDPPRQGCAASLLKRFKNPNVRKIVYISCNPLTFVRDAEILCDNGFDLKKVQPLDLFPQTSHIELVSFFERKPESAVKAPVYVERKEPRAPKADFRPKRRSFNERAPKRGGSFNNKKSKYF